MLIINADDFGMCHSINVATVDAMRNGIVTTTSLMACCPWAWEAMGMLRDDASLSFGVHLTLVNEMPGYRWGPVASKDYRAVDRQPGWLLLLACGDSDALRTRRTLLDVEREFRAQIDRVLGFGLQPTHLDWHCVLDGGRPDILELTLSLCEEHGLAMRVNKPELRESVDRSRKARERYADHRRIQSPGRREERHLGADDAVICEPGFHQWAAHVSTGDAEAQAMEPNAWRVRKTDFDFFTSDEAKQLVAEHEYRAGRLPGRTATLEGVSSPVEHSDDRRM